MGGCEEMGFAPTEGINYDKSYHIPGVCFVLHAFVWSVRAPGAGNGLGGSVASLGRRCGMA